MKAIIGRKIGMIQITADDGVVLPVTLIQAGPCTVTQIKTAESDNYTAIQLGYGQSKKQGKSISGHLKKSSATPEILKEIRVNEVDLKIGDKVEVSNFEVGDKVKVRGTNKGKGFAGTVKRHNFNTGPKSHGSKNVRRPGSIGSMYPQKVYKGRKMPGQLGSTGSTVKNVEVALVNNEDSVIGIKGSIPGPRKSLVVIEGVK